MRILTVLESSSWAEYHIAGSLEELGHTVYRFSYGQYIGEFYGRARHVERMDKNRQLLELAKRLLHDEELDLIFCYVYDDFLLPEYARALADLDVPIVNFNVDMENQWYRQIRTAQYFTRILCAQRTNMENMVRYGAKVMYFPMAARLPHDQKIIEKEWQLAAPVSFVGTPMPYRRKILQHLYKVGVPIAIYGKFWQEKRQATADLNWEKTLSDIRQYSLAKLRAEGMTGLMRALAARVPSRKKPSETEANCELPPDILHGFVPDVAMTTMFRNSKINLGFTRMIGDDPNVIGVNQVKLRDFEVPMAGGFYLVEKAPDYDMLFKPGIEIETWTNTDELLDKIRYYLDHEEERKAIARAGALKAQSEHTWEKRFQALFNEIDLYE